jgi:hypothetical protein
MRSWQSDPVETHWSICGGIGFIHRAIVAVWLALVARVVVWSQIVTAFAHDAPR